MDIMELIRARHSVRRYEAKAIESEKRTALDAVVAECNRESGLNIQIIYDDPKCFNALLSKLLTFRNCANYIVMVGRKDDLELEEKTGYYGECLVLKAQELGLNTCWVGLSHGKPAAKIGADEKLVIVIALGYGANQGFRHKGKTAEQVCDTMSGAPEWFTRGVEAALLAPTAVNQQKFRIERSGEEAKITADKGAYSIVDLGIVKYHFEVASGHKCI